PFSSVGDSGSCAAPNASGSSSSRLHILRSFPAAERTVAWGASSARTWRHAPQGATGSGPSVTSASATRPRIPRATAENTATRSAQTVRPYEAFSTLHPVATAPSTESTAAPTRNREYGAYATRSAARASSTRRSYSRSRSMVVAPDPRQAAGEAGQDLVGDRPRQGRHLVHRDLLRTVPPDQGRDVADPYPARRADVHDGHVHRHAPDDRYAAPSQ